MTTAPLSWALQWIRHCYWMRAAWVVGRWYRQRQRYSYDGRRFLSFDGRRHHEDLMAYSYSLFYLDRCSIDQKDDHYHLAPHCHEGRRFGGGPVGPLAGLAFFCSSSPWSTPKMNSKKSNDACPHPPKMPPLLFPNCNDKAGGRHTHIELQL